MSREEVARQLEWSTSTLFRIETGRNRPQPGNVRMLLELYGVTGPERDGLIQLTREARQPGWWHSFRDVLPNPYEVYIGLEAGAASIRNFEPVVVPGLLQTADYARAILRGVRPDDTEEENEQQVDARIERQQILARQDSPMLWAIMDEGALHRPVGDRQSMRCQLAHLLDVAQKPRIKVLVVPASTGAHVGVGGPFVIAEFRDAPEVAYLDTAAGGQIADHPDLVKACAHAFDSLRAEALPPRASLDLIAEVRDTWT